MQVVPFLSCIFVTSGIAAPGNWTGNYLPCDGHAELLSQSHMELAVRFATADKRLAAEFANALNFWVTVLDMEWHRDASRSCSLAVVDGNSGMFESGQIARAQFPNAPAFQGWIAFNPRVAPDRGEWYFAAVHELGHVFGLTHNPSPSSVMYFLYVGTPMFLDGRDLDELAAHHSLRGAAPDGEQMRHVPVLSKPVARVIRGPAPVRLPLHSLRTALRASGTLSPHQRPTAFASSPPVR